MTDLKEIVAALQQALRLEFFTIPPYLTALYTLSGPSRGVSYARSVLQNVVRDEMLHMNLVANLINALGGEPDVRGAVPTYPDHLPMALAGGLTVHLKRYSRDLVTDVFMEIEQPEEPLDIPVHAAMFAGAVAGPQTIGQFYNEIKAALVREAGQGGNIFVGDGNKQIVEFFAGKGENVAVTSLDTALKAIDIIVEQGEGTPQQPTDLQDDIAHFYAFQQLSKGMRLVPVKPPYFDASRPIEIDDATDVIQMADDPQSITIETADTAVLARSDACDSQFTALVDSLHRGFNGQPDELVSIDDVMREFRSTVKDLLAQRLTVGPAAGLHAGPRFLYRNANGP